MKTIDGAMGEGGGQILRSSLSLSMCTGTPVKIENIRAGRKKPGLLRQHLACVRASQKICNAQVIGDELGSSCVEFIPGEIKAGKYECAIGTAGSTSLLFQTLLPALMSADQTSELYLEGGTHNDAAPSFDFMNQSFMPALEKMNVHAKLNLERYGFYPNGGGAWSAKIEPMHDVKPLNLIERGTLLKQCAVATSAKIPDHVTERELQYIRKKCLWTENELKQRIVESHGPGNIVSLNLDFENVTEVFDAVGRLGASAERVAGQCVRKMKRYLDTSAPVGENLCDQLLVPMAIGNGGKFRTIRPSEHSKTNIHVIQSLTNVTITCEKIDEDLFEINVTK